MVCLPHLTPSPSSLPPYKLSETFGFHAMHFIQLFLSNLQHKLWCVFFLMPIYLTKVFDGTKCLTMHSFPCSGDPSQWAAEQLYSNCTYSYVWVGEIRNYQNSPALSLPTAPMFEETHILLHCSEEKSWNSCHATFAPWSFIIILDIAVPNDITFPFRSQKVPFIFSLGPLCFMDFLNTKIPPKLVTVTGKYQFNWDKPISSPLTDFSNPSVL